MTTTSKLILGLSGAVAAGVLLGLMIAPDKGSSTRKKVKDGTAKLMDSFMHFFSTARSNGEKEMANRIPTHEAVVMH